MAHHHSGNRASSLLSSQVTSQDSVLSETDKQLSGLLHEEWSSLKQSQGPNIPRLLSPAPIGVRESAGSASSSSRTSPAPPLNIPRPSALDAGTPNASQPSTPKRFGGISHGLSLQLATSGSEPSTAPVKAEVRTPLTPKLDPAISYSSPASVLPRRSRGMDFSRAATHLHHSTIAEKPDPESSPTVGGRGISVPRRNGIDSPMRGAGNNCGFDQSTISSSVGSISMMDSGSDSDTDDDVAMRDEDETLTTPHVGRLGMNLSGFRLGGGLNLSPGGDALKKFTAADGKNYRDKLRAKSRKNSETKRGPNGMRYDWTASPGFSSPPVHRSIEGGNDNYFQRELSRRNMQSRRESLSLGTDDLAIDDSTPGSDENRDSNEATAVPEDSTEGRQNVVKRAVTTRRSQLIPRSKGFARIRAALMEESAPIDMENRREAEVIRQVKERDDHQPEKTEESSGPAVSQPATTASSPYMPPASTANPTDSPDDMSEINLEAGSAQPSTRRSSSSFSMQASKNGWGQDFWGRFLEDDRMRTPPPPLFHNVSSSASVFSEDTNMGLEPTSSYSTAATAHASSAWPGAHPSRHGSNSSNNGNSQGQLQPQHYHTQSGSTQRTISPSRGRSSTPTMTAKPSVKALGKRRREDDMDSEFFKRRAVSPGLSSIAGSPILPPSPAQRDNTWWSKGSDNAPGKRETPSGHVAGERLGSTGSENGRQSSSRGMERRVGMQGMNEADKGIMNMSIE